MLASQTMRDNVHLESVSALVCDHPQELAQSPQSELTSAVSACARYMEIECESSAIHLSSRPGSFRERPRAKD